MTERRSSGFSKGRAGHHVSQPAGYRALQNIRDAGDWESWLAFFLRGVSEVCHEAVNTVRKILIMREEHRRIITERLGRVAGNGHCILEYLYKKPFITLRRYRRLRKPHTWRRINWWHVWRNWVF